MTSESVRLASAAPDLNHRDPEYLDLIAETKRRLLAVYPQTQTDWQAFLLGGSGTLAVEAMVTSCVKDGPILIIENGYYSARIRDVVEVHKIPASVVRHDWHEPWDFELIEQELKKGYAAAIAVHNETTTGRLDDIDRLGRLCSRYGADCLIDAMSSFGADPIEFPHLTAVCSSANKCLHGLPGVGFVLVRVSHVERMKEIEPRSYYMHLLRYQGNNPPLTPPVPSLLAFRQALREMPDGGAKERGIVYQEKAAYVRQELLKRGFQPAIPLEDTSCTLTCFSLPPAFTWESWFKANFDAGFVIYGCKGELHEQFFQVSTMGEVTHEQLTNWIQAIDRILMQRA